MKNRSPIAVFFLGLVTLGIYAWYWAVKTKGEMNKLGEQIPTAWIWLIPLVGGIWWYWKYSEGVEHVTHQKLSGVLAFILLYLLGNIGQAIIQDYFNKLEPAIASTPTVPSTVQPAGVVPTTQPTVVVATPSSPGPTTQVPTNQPPASSPPNTPVIGG